MTKLDWTRAERQARTQLDASRDAIESGPRGVPAGRDRSRSTTVRRGYQTITARWGGLCIVCGRKIKPNTQVRYWFGHGISCRRCELGVNTT